MTDDITRAIGDKVLSRLGFAPTELLYQRLGRVLQNRMRRLGLATVDAYADYLTRASDDELGALAEALTINETYLFREPKHFDALKGCLTELARTTDTVRLLSAGCASGEEAYTLAMVAARTLTPLGKRFEVLGVDVDGAALRKAREGLYGRWSFRDEGLEHAQGFVKPEGDKWRVIPRVRDAVRFQQLNLTEAAPTGPFHVVFCRNMLMYLTPAHRRAVVERLVGLLPPGGAWFLGSSETLDEAPGELERVPSCGTYFYRRRAASRAAGGASGAGARPGEPARVLLVGATPLFRVVLRQLLRAADDIELVSEERELDAAQARATECGADVIVYDALDAQRLDALAGARRGGKVLAVALADARVPRHLAADTLLAADAGSAALKSVAPELLERVRAAGKRRARGVTGALTRPVTAGLAPRASGTGTLTRPSSAHGAKATRLLLIGSSTGGPAAVTALLQALPAGLGLGVLVVQHMPAGFTASFAERLDRASAYSVAEAATGAPLLADTAYVAPGGLATLLRPNGTLLVVAHDTADIYVPNINRAFRSAVDAGLAERVIAVELTGMGDDGAEGLLALREAGAETLAQDPAEAVVPGMPRAALALGGARGVSSLDALPLEIARLARERPRVRRSA